MGGASLDHIKSATLDLSSHGIFPMIIRPKCRRRRVHWEGACANDHASISCTIDERLLSYHDPWARDPGEVHGPGYPAGVRTYIWHPTLTEAHLKGKGHFFLRKKYSLDFVENCKFLINKNIIFHEFTRIVT